MLKGLATNGMEDDAMLGNIGEAQERLNQWKAKMEDHAANMAAANEELTAITATCMHPNGTATVTVDSGGHMISLELSSEVRRQNPQATARHILETLTEAKQEAARLTTEIASRHFGADSPTTKVLADNAKSGLRNEEH